MIKKRTILCLNVVLLFIVLGSFILNYKYCLFSLNCKSECCALYDLKIITFNTDLSENITEDRCKELIKLVNEEKPDILCLQEVAPEAFEFLKHDLDSIFGYKYDDPILKESLRHCIYSKYHIDGFNRYKCRGDIDTTGFSDEQKDAIELYMKQMSAYSADIKVQNRDVRVFWCHLRSSAYSTARRSMTDDQSWLAGLPLYYHNYEIGKRIRDYEAINLRRYIDESIDEDKAVIIAGDMNDWCGSDCLDILQGSDNSELKDSWWEGGNGFGWTYFGWNLRLRLDHILYSDDFELTDVEVIDSDISDHKPLMAKFRLK